MKKRLASLVIGLSVALSLAIPVGAAEMKTPVTEFESVTKEETIIHDVEFLSDATITTEDLAMTRTQFSCGIKKNHTLTLNLGKVAAQQPRLLPLERKSSRKLNKVFRQRFPAQAKRRRVAGSIWGTLLMPK